MHERESCVGQSSRGLREQSFVKTYVVVIKISLNFLEGIVVLMLAESRAIFLRWLRETLKRIEEVEAAVGRLMSLPSARVRYQLVVRRRPLPTKTSDALEASSEAFLAVVSRMLRARAAAA